MYTKFCYYLARALTSFGTKRTPRITAITPMPTGAATAIAELKFVVTAESISAVIGNVDPVPMIYSPFMLFCHTNDHNKLYIMRVNIYAQAKPAPTIIIKIKRFKLLSICDITCIISGVSGVIKFTPYKFFDLSIGSRATSFPCSLNSAL